MRYNLIKIKYREKGSATISNKVAVLIKMRRLVMNCYSLHTGLQQSYNWSPVLLTFCCCFLELWDLFVLRHTCEMNDLAGKLVGKFDFHCVIYWETPWINPKWVTFLLHIWPISWQSQTPSERFLLPHWAPGIFSTTAALYCLKSSSKGAITFKHVCIYHSCDCNCYICSQISTYCCASGNMCWI